MEQARKSDLVDLTLHRHAETDRAILLSDDDVRATAVWLPKSQVEIEETGTKSIITVTMPEGLAIEKGLV